MGGDMGGDLGGGFHSRQNLGPEGNEHGTSPILEGRWLKAVQHCRKLATRLVRDDLADEFSSVACTDDDLTALTVQECTQRLARGVELSR